MSTRHDSRSTAKTAARYNRIASIYDVLESGMEHMARGWRALLWAQVKGRKILEVGVGTGKNIPFYPPGLDVTAIDLSERMLERARRRARLLGAPVDLRQMDVQALRFPDRSFDTVVATFVFCSVPDPVQGLREIGRVTMPSGRILLLEHMRPTNPVLGKVFDGLNPVVVHMFGFNVNRRTLENVNRAGLVVESVKELGKGGIFRLIVARPGGKLR
ncbi:MAG: class I SAM-dependent methyltransferase [Candidatus Bipolaricaulia bacterium]